VSSRPSGIDGYDDVPGRADPDGGPLAGLLQTALIDPLIADAVAVAGRPIKRLTGPVGLRPFLAGALALAKDSGGAGVPVCLVTATGREADTAAAALADLLGAGRVEVFPSWETLPHERLSPRADTVGRRVSVLRRLAHPDEHPGGAPAVIVTTVRSLIQPMAPDLGEIAPVRLVAGDEADLTDTVQRLVDLAYTRVDLVEKRGEIAVRGGIVDVFSPTAAHPVRAQFDGELVASLRTFSVADQRSIEDVPAVIAPPCREILLTDAVRARAAGLSASETGDPTLAEMIGKIASGVGVEGMESLIPALLPGQLVMLGEQLPAGTHVILADPERIRTRAADLVRTGAEFLAASWMAAASGGQAPIDLGESAYRDLDRAIEAIEDRDLPVWRLSPFVEAPLEVQADGAVTAVAVPSGPAADAEPAAAPTPSYRGDLGRAFADIRANLTAGGTTVLVVAGPGTAARAADQLGEAEIPARVAERGLDGVPRRDVVTVTCGHLEDGVILGGSKLTIVTEADLTGNRGGAPETVTRTQGKRRHAIDPATLQVGDFVVHSKHGIGKYVELVSRTVGGATRDYLVVEYASSKRGQPGDRLFVPTDSLDQLSRYVGGEVPPLNKLGGSDWAKTKGRARKAVRQIAAKLVDLYAKRAAAQGHAFGPDSPWQRELEEAFPFTETPDQAAAIDDVKRDMERTVPMDRVIAGDVGYGKTEIAVRAAFKAVQDGKQVVVLAPTTLLAQQHVATFGGRMAQFPVTVRGLSRFTSDADAKEVIAGLADGSVDIVIGTHRLLQKSVRYKNLGLVIVDEEQRFGVEHKEHITELKAGVDMLTMSATPIPRTLEMSLAGIREMSTIATPPEDRHPILTYVGAYDDKLIAAAIRRELLRDGQVFYVHNRVKDIEAVTRRLRELVPEARIAVAHGQMNEHTLEEVIDGFWERRYDVLVCTTIIETGLDISNANTLIVDRSEILGLAQMHQLRGRVGRSRERGYAYFLYPADKPLTETANDRLATIAQNSALGAGLAVAMRDLEIRGAGSILGAEQSGHIAGVGFDLYVRLVGEAVTAFKRAARDAAGEEAENEPIDVRIELPVDAAIPADYIDAERLRLDAYRRIASAADGDELDAVRAELTDRYGPIGPETANLFAVAALKKDAAAAGVSEIVMTGRGLKFGGVELPESAQLRTARLYRGSVYRPATHSLTLAPPTESDRIGSPQLTGMALLEFCQGVLRAIRPASVPVAQPA
jgi:transcription-repair coupling factor (superfamily II helicase)